jgi:hypothetical protein
LWDQLWYAGGAQNGGGRACADDGDLADPIDPIDLADPIDPIDPTDLADPIDLLDLRDPDSPRA